MAQKHLDHMAGGFSYGIGGGALGEKSRGAGDGLVFGLSFLPTRSQANFHKKSSY